MDKETLMIVLKVSERSFHNEEIIKSSTKCGCYHCCSIFVPSEIKEWADESPRTAICPYCGIDAVLDDKAFEPFNRKGLIAISKMMF